MPTVRFVYENKNIEATPGSTILEAARAAGVTIETPCNGVGTCGKCRVQITDLSQLTNLKNEGAHSLPEEETRAGFVLACQSRAYGGISVIVPGKEQENKGLRILATGNTFEYALKPFFTKQFDGQNTQILAGNKRLGFEPGDTAEQIYGIALDIGTTTLVAELIHLPTGRRLASESMLNPQTSYAQDVLTRIHFAAGQGGLDTLYHAFLSAFQSLRDSLTRAGGVAPENIYEVVFSGNTTMLHLATGADPTPLGKFPYNMNLTGGELRGADELGISPFGLIYLPPVISAFVGADITSGILASQLGTKQGVTLFIDIGTNGEMVIASNGKLAATSTAAGPAFEGMNIACGMRASPGAVEQFSINESHATSYKTIGDEKAGGICGSGLLDIVGELARTGVLGESGRFVKNKDKLPWELAQKLGEYAGKPAFYITGNVFLTLNDVRQVQLAKGAVRAGVTALLAQLEIAEAQVDEVLIAGSFGYHLREASLLNIGLIPRSFEGKVRFIGNTSQSGAAAFLLNTDFRESMRELVCRVDKIELSNTPDFERLFVNSLGFSL